jgi:hypothetical protein
MFRRQQDPISGNLDFPWGGTERTRKPNACKWFVRSSTANGTSIEQDVQDLFTPWRFDHRHPAQWNDVKYKEAHRRLAHGGDSEDGGVIETSKQVIGYFSR